MKLNLTNIERDAHGLWVRHDDVNVRLAAEFAVTALQNLARGDVAAFAANLALAQGYANDAVVADNSNT